MTESSIEQGIEAAAAAIGRAEALLVTAGAGMGVDSGLPDFRGQEGFWRAYPVIAKLGLSFEEMANPGWFRETPGLAWAFYGHRLNLYRRTLPHAGFGQLLEMASRRRHGGFVFTSNVDGQFQKAGFPPDRIVECHGSIHHWQCTIPCTEEVWEAGQETVAVDERTFRAVEPLPKCQHCGAVARPNILMFGDGAWLPHRSAAKEESLARWLESMERSGARLAVIELGAGTAVPTVRLTSEAVARRLQATLIRLNPRESDVPAGHIGLPLGAAEGVRRIAARSDLLRHHEGGAIIA